MADGYAEQVRSRAEKIRAFQLAVFRESAQRTVEVMQEPGPSKASTRIAIAAGSGLGKLRQNGTRGASKKTYGPVHSGGTGNLPVDTGFLRASLRAGIGNVNFSVRQKPEEGGSFAYDDGAIVMVIAKAKLGETISVGYTAAYARAAEYGSRGRPGRRFVGLAAQRFPQIVQQVTAEAKARVGL